MSSVTELLHTKYPLVQAPMNWATDARFVAAVANAGALQMNDAIRIQLGAQRDHCAVVDLIRQRSPKGIARGDED